MRDVAVDELGRSLVSGHLPTPTGRREPQLGAGQQATPTAGHADGDVTGAVAAW